MNEEKKISKKKVLISIIILACIIFFGLYFYIIKKEKKDTIYIEPDGTKPYRLIGGGGERIYLNYGTIYALTDDPNKEFNIVNYVIHITSEQYKKLIFFDTPEDAEKAGYKPAKNFAKEYACFKEGKDTIECSSIEI